MFPYSQMESPQQYNINLDNFLPKDLLEDESLEDQLLRHSESGNQLIVQSLLEQDVNPNVTNEQGETPLHKAALKGHVVIMGLLLKARANKYALTSDLKTPMAYAIKGGQFEAVRFLLKKAKYGVNYQNSYYPNHKTPLEDVCYYCNFDRNIDKFIKIAKILLRNGALVTLASKAIFTNVRLLSPPESNVHRKYTTPQEMLIPNKKAIYMLILAGVNREEIVRILNEKSDSYDRQQLMAWGVHSKYIDAKHMCCTMPA